MRAMHIGIVAGIAAAALASSGGIGRAAMGGATIMSRLDADHDGKITLDEVRAAAGRTYDTIARANGGKVGLLQLGGRVSAGDMKAAKLGANEASQAVSKDDYLALAARFFADANVSVKKGTKSFDGTLGMDELTTPAGKKLIALLE